MNRSTVCSLIYDSVLDIDPIACFGLADSWSEYVMVQRSIIAVEFIRRCQEEKFVCIDSRNI